MKRRSLIYPTIQDIIEWIETDLARPMQTETIAEKAGYSRWHIQRVFKAMTGHTLTGYIRARRMSVAAKLLKETSLSVTEIYSKVGYIEGTHFCRAFKKHFGVSPTELRFGEDDFSNLLVERVCLGRH